MARPRSSSSSPTLTDLVRARFQVLLDHYQLSQRGLATLLGRDQSGISLLLAGKRHAGELDLWLSIAQHFDYRLSEVIAEAENIVLGIETAPGRSAVTSTAGSLSRSVISPLTGSVPLQDTTGLHALSSSTTLVDPSSGPAGSVFASPTPPPAPVAPALAQLLERIEALAARVDATLPPAAGPGRAAEDLPARDHAAPAGGLVGGPTGSERDRAPVLHRRGPRRRGGR